MYKVLSHNKAAKYYENLDDKTTKRIDKAIEEISANPLRKRYHGPIRLIVINGNKEQIDSKSLDSGCNHAGMTEGPK